MWFVRFTLNGSLAVSHHTTDEICKHAFCATRPFVKTCTLRCPNLDVYIPLDRLLVQDAVIPTRVAEATREVVEVVVAAAVMMVGLPVSNAANRDTLPMPVRVDS